MHHKGVDVEDGIRSYALVEMRRAVGMPSKGWVLMGNWMNLFGEDRVYLRLREHATAGTR